MTPESPLQQCKRHFENFQAQTPKTVKADEVQINQEVSFKVNCREEALETLTIHNIVQDFKDGDTEYLMLQETVDGPVTDGNRVEFIDSCLIKTYVEMYPKGEIPKVAKVQGVVAAKPMSKAQPLEQGCKANGSSVLLLMIMAALVMRGKYARR